MRLANKNKTLFNKEKTGETGQWHELTWHSGLKGSKPKKNSPGLRLVVFWQITSRVTTKNLKIGQRGNGCNQMIEAFAAHHLDSNQTSCITTHTSQKDLKLKKN